MPHLCAPVNAIMRLADIFPGSAVIKHAIGPQHSDFPTQNALGSLSLL